jgi:hypothetical protein
MIHNETIASQHKKSNENQPVDRAAKSFNLTPKTLSVIKGIQGINQKNFFG